MCVTMGRGYPYFTIRQSMHPGMHPVCTRISPVRSALTALTGGRVLAVKNRNKEKPSQAKSIRARIENNFFFLGRNN